jgi:heme/copper-type cytochrome/quinol oxidase subunit 4
MLRDIKSNIIGFILIILGVLPFLTGIQFVGEYTTKYPYLLPGQIAYQVVIIVLGVILIIKKLKVQTTNN